MRIFIFFSFVLFLISSNLNTWAQIQWQSHPLSLEKEHQERVKFGYLTVTESRNKLNSREIYMAFTVVKSYSDNPLPDPVILIPGGPGGGASEHVRMVFQSDITQKILQNRDLILVDPRGCGYSYPAICDNLNTKEFQLRSTFSRGQENAVLFQEAIKECAEIISASGADVSAYSSVEVAHDIEELRIALGYDQWNIRGHSYGSRFGMTLIQQHPESVRSAVLSGLVRLNHYYDKIPVNLSRSLRILIGYCEADPDCNKTFPDLESDLIQLLKKLDNDPIPIPGYLTKSISGESYFITPDMLLQGLFRLAYSKQGLEIVPQLIHHLAQGHEWIAQSMTMPLVTQFHALKSDMNMIITNNDDEVDPEFLSPPINDELHVIISNYLKYMHDESIDKYWPVIRGTEPVPAEVWNPSDIPVLMISGELDPITPPSHGDTAMVYFTNAVHYVIPGSGHSPHSDAQIDFSTFYDNPEVYFDSNSTMDVKPLRFVTDVSLNRGVSELLARLGAKHYRHFIIPAMALMFCLVGFLYFPFRYILRKLRKKPTKGIFMQILAVWLVPLLSLTVAVLFYFAIMDAMATNPYMLVFGLPGEWAFIKIIAVVLTILLLVNIFISRKIWRDSGIKAPLIISLLGGIGFTSFIWLAGMII